MLVLALFCGHLNSKALTLSVHMKYDKLIFMSMRAYYFQCVTFHAGLRVLPAGTLGISQEIQHMFPMFSPKLCQKGGKCTLND